MSEKWGEASRGTLKSWAVGKQGPITRVVVEKRCEPEKRRNLSRKDKLSMRRRGERGVQRTLEERPGMSRRRAKRAVPLADRPTLCDLQKKEEKYAKGKILGRKKTSTKNISARPPSSRTSSKGEGREANGAASQGRWTDM